MTHHILGLHHVTATVDEAQPDVDFCIGGLGLRLVKKTVNFDNHHVYHFYYGNEGGTPGTIWTTFPYHGRGVRVGVKGAGQIAVTSFSVPPSSLEFWRDRLTRLGMNVEQVERPFDDRTLMVTDPSGLAIELVESVGRPRGLDGRRHSGSLRDPRAAQRHPPGPFAGADGATADGLPRLSNRD